MNTKRWRAEVIYQHGYALVHFDEFAVLDEYIGYGGDSILGIHVRINAPAARAVAEPVMPAWVNWPVAPDDTCGNG